MRLLLGSLLLALVTASTVPAASADGPESVTLKGLGFGHGKGMSQYGAQAAAKQGLSHRRILKYYYPGTRVGTAGGRIRVLITADTTSRVMVRHRSGLKVRSVRTGQVWSLTKRGAKRWKVTPASGNRASRLWVRTNRWRAVRVIPGEAEFHAGGAPVRVYTSAGADSYRGRIRSAVPPSGGGRDTVNVVRLEHYLRGVVPDEMPATWHPNAVRAQAVAARTYAVHERTSYDRGHFDVWDTTQSQVYGGVESEHRAATAAIRATKREIRTYDGRPAFTQFGSSNGGWTASGTVPYQQAKADPYDPRTPWTATISAAAIERAWPAIGDFVRLDTIRRDGGGAGHVVTLRVVGSKRSATVAGEHFRSYLGLRSSLITKVS